VSQMNWKKLPKRNHHPLMEPKLKYQHTSITYGKVLPHHHDRIAIVYIHQSSLQQVQHHSESTKLQYVLPKLRSV